MKTNSAAWIPSKQAKLEVKAAPYTPPREGEIVIRNRAVAVNPLDWIKQSAGDLVFGWIKYPFILGSDTAGEVAEVGPDITRFKVGDRALAHAVGTDPKRNSAAEGTFQTYSVILERMAAPIPSEMSFESAAVLPLGLSTAACGLFQKDFLALDYPSLSPNPQGKTLLVWGGSTSVGSNAIQLAVAAGYEVITTASPRNFDYVRKLGASRAFDYNSRTVIADVIEAFKDRTLAGALSIGAGSAAACVDVVHACKGNKFVAMATFPISFGSEGRAPNPASIIPRFLWFSISMGFKTLTRKIRTKFIFGSSLVHNELAGIIYADFLPKALAERRYVAAPDPVIIGKGLDHLQPALDMQRKGVSASKIVVSLP